MKLSDYVIDFLVRQEVRHVFLLTGGLAMHLNDSLGQRREIEYVCCLHEQACAIAAEAYAKYQNRLGVAMVTVGPGATNTLTGVAGAWLDSTPLLILSGQVKRADLKAGTGLRNRGVQEVDIVTMVGSITKYSVTVTDPQSIRYHLEKAAHLATTGRPGPVWIDLPLDVQAVQIDPDTLPGYPAEPVPDVLAASALRAAVGRTLELLAAAERPFLLLGNGVRLANARAAMTAVLEKLGVPFGLTWPALDLAPQAHPLLVGRPGPMAPRGANFALQNADFVLTVGARLDVVTVAFAPEKFARAARKVVVDLDPNELRKMEGFADLTVCADAGQFLAELLAQADALPPHDRSPWLARCREWKTKYPVIQPAHRAPGEKVSMYHLTEILGQEMEPDGLIVPTSSGNAIETVLLAFEVTGRQRLFNTTGLGPMGFGLPAAIGGCLAHGRRQTICVDGDGGFQMNVQELETIARLQLPVVIFVINNNGYGSIITSQTNYFGRLVGADPSSGVTLPDVCRQAAVYGIPARRVTGSEDLRAAVRAVLRQPGPQLVEIMAAPNEERAPRVSSAMRADGVMVTKPLEDLWPFLEREEFLANMLIAPLPESL